MDLKNQDDYLDDWKIKKRKIRRFAEIRREKYHQDQHFQKEKRQTKSQ